MQKFMFMVGGKVLVTHEVNELAREFGYYRSFNASECAPDAERFHRTLVEKNPAVPVLLFALTQYSVPQPAELKKVTF